MKQNRYSNNGVLKHAKVLEALRGLEFEPVTLKRVSERTGFNANYCFRALQTWEEIGWAKQLEDGRWTVTTQLMRFSRTYEETLENTI